MNKKSIRVQLSEEEILNLTKVYKDLGCIYRGKPSHTRLLSKIASEELIISHKNKKKQLEINKSSIIITLQVIGDLNGTISAISQKVADINGNILDVFATDSNDIVRLSVLISPDLDINALCHSLSTIKFKEIKEYNPLEKIINIINNTNPESKLYYDSMVKKDPYIAKSVLEQFWKDLENTKIISDINYSFGLRVVTENTPGKLAELTKIIASFHISILYIELKSFYRISELNIMNMILGINPNVDSNNIKGINIVIKKLRRLPYIKEINQIGINELNK